MFGIMLGHLLYDIDMTRGFGSSGCRDGCACPLKIKKLIPFAGIVLVQVSFEDQIKCCFYLSCMTRKGKQMSSDRLPWHCSGGVVASLSIICSLKTTLPF